METNDDERFMRAAIAEAQAAEAREEVPVGAVVVCRNRIIARAHNLTETLRDVTAHAEMQAITAAADYLGGKYLNECTIYVTVEPCTMCAGAIGWAQVGKLVYGAGDPKRAVDELSHLCPAYCTGAHGARLNGYIDCALVEVFPAQIVCCRRDGLHFGVGRYVA